MRSSKYLKPWDDISIPRANEYHKKLVDSFMIIPCHWAKDSDGTLLFLIELEGRNEASFRKNNIKVSGIDIDLRSISSDRQIVVLGLQKQLDQDLFEGFCQSLINVLYKAVNPGVALELLFAHLKRWKVFLSGKKRLMSDESVSALFAELSFLKELMDRYDEEFAVQSWLGSERNQHDFSFDRINVEIKSLRGVERGTVHISSEDQLYTTNECLYLRIYFLNEGVDELEGISLNGLITQINDNINSSKIETLFFEKLNRYGYMPIMDYDKPYFFLRQIDSYIVSDEFPKITEKMLPVGVSKVKYQISLEHIENFKCNNKKLLEG